MGSVDNHLGRACRACMEIAVTTSEHITSKLTSGRFIITVVASGVFAFLACTGGMDAGDAQTIIAVVITFYFQRERATQ